MCKRFFLLNPFSFLSVERELNLDLDSLVMMMVSIVCFFPLFFVFSFCCLVCFFPF